MSLRGWLGTRVKPHSSTKSLDSLKEPQELENAMRAVSHIMNDDVDQAEKLLSEGNSAFHKLGKGVVVFLRATLGFEQEIMKEASEKLADAESTAYDQQRRAQRDPGSRQSSIYSAGTEYALCSAEAQLMSAVVAVLTESLTESIKGFYKLRKAFITLDAIMEEERRYVTQSSNTNTPRETMSSRPTTGSNLSLSTSKSSAAQSSQVRSPSPSKYFGNSSDRSWRGSLSRDEDEDGDDEDEFFDADETHGDAASTTTYMGHLEIDTHKNGESEDKKQNLIGDQPLKLEPEMVPQSTYSPSTGLTSGHLTEGVDADIFGENPVDLFIHSGSNLCYGLLLLIISMIPPAFATLLKIVGFKGDRERGIAMLWQASKFENINGALAGLMILGYYHNLVGVCDILPKSGDSAYPKQKCAELLNTMRQRYPKSHLWLLEDARMQAGNHKLEKAVDLLSGQEKSPLRQVEALGVFEKGMNCMFMHSYEECSKSFIQCISLNSWSHGLYYYNAGVAHVELYRKYKVDKPEKAEKHATEAERLLREVPKYTGKKRFMARQLPMDVFVDRKVKKWDQRAQQWGVDFIDAIGVSPVEEMIYFWNGYKRMRKEQLEDSLERLSWSSSDQNKTQWEKEPLDERAIQAVLKATALRNLERTEEAKKLLEQEVIGQEWHEFKGVLKDNWPCPCAHYEMAAILWEEYDNSSPSPKKTYPDQSEPSPNPNKMSLTKSRTSSNQDILIECSSWLKKVTEWETFELDARIGLKVTTGKETLKRYGIETS